MQVALVGMAVGMAGAAAATKLIAGLLYDVQPHDLPTFAAVAIVFGLTAFAACCGPAIRAARVDPIVALRYE